MVHLLLFDGNRVCGSHDGTSSDFIELVTCQTCIEWNEANSLARQAIGFSEFDYEVESAFEQANGDMNARL